MGLDEVREIVARLTDDERATLTPLGGGVSCQVVLVSSSDGKWVVKVALPRLLVRDEWLADRSRIFREAGCLKIIRELVDSSAAPKVILEDRMRYACVMEYGDGGVTWKEMLMKGIIEPKITEKVASLLAKLHVKTHGLSRVVEEFGDDTNFLQLRVDPYIIHTSRKHPDISGQLLKVAELLRSRKLSLVHGDYSPKNILVLPDGRIWALDCEPAHYGNPAFDIAFCTNHLILKSIHYNSVAHLMEGRRLWRLYWREVDWGESLEDEGVLILAALMLARVDGKSPVEYLSEENRSRVRRLSRGLISEGVSDFDGLTDRVLEEIG